MLMFYVLFDVIDVTFMKMNNKFFSQFYCLMKILWVVVPLTITLLTYILQIKNALL